jgi:CheY-like chemotaxis protein
LLNLLNNAVKFTEQGWVALCVSATSADDQREVRLTFEVEDTGGGIAALDQAAIFDAFVQTNSAKGHEGVGLGLTISRQIIELMGGTIQVESTPGRGSRFRTQITVERAQASELNRGPDSQRVTALAEGQPAYRILIVEDQQENSMVLERLLEDAGFQVRVARNGAEGVQEFREWQPQFIWMDLRMPVMDGIESTRRIRTCEGGREVKIAAVTASGYASERREILAEGVDDYVRKPYRPAEIFECMARHLGVCYRLAETPPVSSAGPLAELRLEAIAALPADLRAALRDALTTLEANRISQALERVAEHDATLGSVLARYAEKFAYTAIYDAIKGVERGLTGEEHLRQVPG